MVEEPPVAVWAAVVLAPTATTAAVWPWDMPMSDLTTTNMPRTIVNSNLEQQTSSTRTTATTLIMVPLKVLLWEVWLVLAWPV